MQPRGCVELIGCGGELGYWFTAAIGDVDVLYRARARFSIRALRR